MAEAFDHLDGPIKNVVHQIKTLFTNQITSQHIKFESNGYITTVKKKKIVAINNFILFTQNLSFSHIYQQSSNSFI